MRKTKKIMLGVIGVILLMTLSPAIVLAGTTSPPDYGNYNPLGLLAPPESWGVEKVLPSLAPGGQTHIITDPLDGVGSDATGWVTFWCQSKVGFQYNIGTYSGLNPLSKYSVRAYGVKIKIVPPGTGTDTGEGFWIDPTTLTTIEPLELGTFETDANGLGGVKGVVQLHSGWLYDVGTVVSDIDGHPVLSSPNDDTNGFIVY